MTKRVSISDKKLPTQANLDSLFKPKNAADATVSVDKSVSKDTDKKNATTDATSKSATTKTDQSSDGKKSMYGRTKVVNEIKTTAMRDGVEEPISNPAVAKPIFRQEDLSSTKTQPTVFLEKVQPKSVRGYYQNFKRRKQASIYLPRTIQIALKSKAAGLNMNFSDFVLETLLKTLTDEEIKAAYEYDLNHPQINR